MKEVNFMLGGQQRTLRFDIGTLKLIGGLEKAEQSSLDEVIDGYNHSIRIVYCGIQRDCQLKKTAFELSQEQVQEWIDCLSSMEVVAIFKAFNEAFKVEETEEGKGGDDKKK